MCSAVLIASEEHLCTLKERDDLAGATAFCDRDALRAFDSITQQRPPVVVLEQLFATTSRGTALIQRIKADPSLGGCEIRIVVAHTEPSRGTGQGNDVDRATALPITEAQPPSAMSLDQLDQKGTRRAPRFRIIDGIECQIDGDSTALIDLSMVGAQIVSPTILKPNQRLRVALADGSRPIRFNGAVAWANFEIPKNGPRYRAGVEFFEADARSITQIIDNKQIGPA